MSRVGILKGEREKRNRRWGVETRYPGCWVVGTGKCGKRICTFPLRWQKASTEKRHLAEHSLGWPYARNVSSKQLVVFWSKRGGWAGRRERNRRQDSTQWALRCWVVTWSLESRWSWLNFYDSGQTSLPSSVAWIIPHVVLLSPLFTFSIQKPHTHRFLTWTQVVAFVARESPKVALHLYFKRNKVLWNCLQEFRTLKSRIGKAI